MRLSAVHDVCASPEYPPPSVEETASVDLTKPRVQGEELLRTSYEAIVLRVAGIYGLGRDPAEWIKTGRVKRSQKYVNLIHVEDLALTCLAALAHGEPGNVYNVSDGNPRTWMEICKLVEQRSRYSICRLSGCRLTRETCVKQTDVRVAEIAGNRSAP